MTETRISPVEHAPALGRHHAGHDPADASQTSRRLARHLPVFWRHFVEMFVAMWVGMAVGGVAFGAVLAVFGTSINEARLRYPELAVLIMGFDMTVPMVAWMRHRGHAWRSSAEMAAAMILPAIPCIVLIRAHVIVFGATCGVYCASMTIAMLGLMLYRRDEYSSHVAHAI